MRKDYTLLREGQGQEDLFGDIEAGGKARGATVWRLFGLAKHEVWVSDHCRAVMLLQYSVANICSCR